MNRWEMYTSRLKEILTDGSYLNQSAKKRYAELQVTTSFDIYAIYEAWLMADQPCKAQTKSGNRCRNRCRWHDDPNSFVPDINMLCHHHRDIEPAD